MGEKSPYKRCADDMFEPLPFAVTQNLKIAEGIFSLTMEPADGRRLFDFEAGQFVMLQLLNPDGSVWAQAPYSIADAPCETTHEIRLGIKLEGDFTTRAARLAPGDEVRLRAPYGVFTLRDHEGPSVFFAGGIGIVPIRSMIREALLEGRKESVFLFYSCRSRAEMAYEAEFRDLATQYSHFYPVFCVTRERPGDWKGECERVNTDLVKRYFKEFGSARFYMCGPQPFMDSIHAMLKEEGVDVKDCLHKESF